MGFISINEGFICQKCGHRNTQAAAGCRNHCVMCLYSLHLDESFPGDRQSQCSGLMGPVAATHNGKKGWMIEHRCEKCGKIILNKMASDDNFNTLIQISNEQAGK